MIASSNNYKNALKKLRKVNSSLINERKKPKLGNYYKYLTEVEEEPEQEPKQASKEIVREKRDNIDFNDLPEDTIYKILQFLSANTRLAILKHKYNRNFVKCKLQKMPETNKELTQMWKCADIAFHILESVLNDDSKLVNNFSSYPIRFFKKEKDPKKYSRYYKENFTEIILAAIRHYSRIYKFGHYTNIKVIEHIEKIMINVFVHLSKIK
jgi:hypothetical protein